MSQLYNNQAEVTKALTDFQKLLEEEGNNRGVMFSGIFMASLFNKEAGKVYPAFLQYPALLTNGVYRKQQIKMLEKMVKYLKQKDLVMDKQESKNKKV